MFMLSKMWCVMYLRNSEFILMETYIHMYLSLLVMLTHFFTCLI
jgi:hypothetical protein